MLSASSVTRNDRQVSVLQRTFLETRLKFLTRQTA